MLGRASSALSGIVLGFALVPGPRQPVTMKSALCRDGTQSDAPVFFHHQAWACEPKTASPPKQ